MMHGFFLSLLLLWSSGYIKASEADDSAELAQEMTNPPAQELPVTPSTNPEIEQKEQATQPEEPEEPSTPQVPVLQEETPIEDQEAPLDQTAMPQTTPEPTPITPESEEEPTPEQPETSPDVPDEEPTDLSEPELPQEPKDESAAPTIEDIQSVIPEPVNQEESAQETPQAMQPIPEEPESEIIQIDTVNVDEPKGNWLFKRYWWEKAERLYEKIKNLVDQVVEVRLDFFRKRNDLDRNLFDPFYLQIGMDQGELQQIVNYFMGHINQERLAQNTADEKTRELLDRVQAEKETLTQLQSSVGMVMKLDHAIDDALDKLLEQLNLARSYERDAWEKLKSITREISDKKAHELYLSIDANWKNINNINNYISREFTKHFQELLQKATSEVENIKATIGTLKERDINILTDAKRLANQISEEKETEEIEQEEEPEAGWLSTIWRWISAPFRYIYYGFAKIGNWISSLFGGTKTESESPDLESSAFAKAMADREEPIEEPQEAPAPDESIPNEAPEEPQTT
jgi:hypothetical protein